MDNRFFDIDSNIYLNSLYMLTALYKSDKSLRIKDLLMLVYLIKNPRICLILLNKRNKLTFQKHVHQYEFDNIQSEMVKYTSKIYTDGFNESLSFLFSKNLITYEVDSTLLYGSSEFNKLNFKKFPKDLLYKASYANKIMSNYSQRELESKINDLWKVLL